MKRDVSKRWTAQSRNVREHLPTLARSTDLTSPVADIFARYFNHSEAMASLIYGR